MGVSLSRRLASADIHIQDGDDRHCVGAVKELAGVQGGVKPPALPDCDRQTAAVLTMDTNTSPNSLCAQTVRKNSIDRTNIDESLESIEMRAIRRPALAVGPTYSGLARTNVACQYHGQIWIHRGLTGRVAKQEEGAEPWGGAG